MKKQLKTLAVALVSVLSVATGYAREHVEKEPARHHVGMYYDTHRGTIKTFIEKEAGQSLLISFQDANGNEMESTIVSKKRQKGMISFDVNALPSGTYQIKIGTGKEQSVHIVEINHPTTPKQTVTIR